MNIDKWYLMLISEGKKVRVRGIIGTGQQVCLALNQHIRSLDKIEF